jgi:hypothetical protein
VTIHLIFYVLSPTSSEASPFAFLSEASELSDTTRTASRHVAGWMCFERLEIGPCWALATLGEIAKPNGRAGVSAVWQGSCRTKVPLTKKTASQKDSEANDIRKRRNGQNAVDAPAEANDARAFACLRWVEAAGRCRCSWFLDLKILIRDSLDFGGMILFDRAPEGP